MNIKLVRKSLGLTQEQASELIGVSVRRWQQWKTGMNQMHTAFVYLFQGGGFPCQPFSNIGKREGFNHPTQGTMFHEIVRIVEEKSPQIVFLENVPGFVSHDEGRTLKVIVRTLKEMGYKVFYHLLDAEHFGVPQRRKRFYLIAFLNNSVNFPPPSHQ